MPWGEHPTAVCLTEICRSSSLTGPACALIAPKWILCAAVLMRLVREGDDVHPTHLVMMLVCANMGYVWADVASDGFMVWVAHREPIKKRGKMQMLVYSVYNLGQASSTYVCTLRRARAAACRLHELDADVHRTSHSRTAGGHDRHFAGVLGPRDELCRIRARPGPPLHDGRTRDATRRSRVISK